MKTYEFKIKWADSYAPIELLKEYSDQYSRLTSYSIYVKANSCKTAIANAEAFIKARLTTPAKFTLIPNKGDI